MFRGYSKQQTDRIDKVGSNYGLSPTKSRETFVKICQSIASEMSSFKSDENKIVDETTMKTINIPQLGKLIPKISYTQWLNKKRLECIENGTLKSINKKEI